MCGIAGVAGRVRLAEHDRTAVTRAANAMQHRGPDGVGVYSSNQSKSDTAGGICMAMRRLSIIDLQHGWQPHKNEDESVVVIVNGEIYNYVELRAELKARGHVLRAQSDGEVLVHLYEDLGLDFVHRLQGMFAFALWDTKKRCLILGRDRLGEKPLYLHTNGQQLWFTSELKALLATGLVPLELDAKAIHAYLHYGWVAEPASIVTSVRKLPPGHLLVVDIDQWEMREIRYWRLEDVPAVSGNAVELVRAELDILGARIVRADVPIGVALSGGLDSTLVAALAARHSTAPVRAYTIGYEGRPPQDERELASVVARDLGLDHRTIEIAPRDMIADFPRVAVLRDDPIADISGYGYFKVSEHARADGCPVLLQGQGADELLWGYPWTVEAVRQTSRLRAGRPMALLQAFYEQLPRRLSRPDMVRFAYFLGGIAHGWRLMNPGVSAPVGGMVAYDLTDSYQIGKRAAAATYAPEFIARLGDGICHEQRDIFESLNASAPIDIQMIAALCRGYLLQNGLAQGDRLSMANSVELRLPLVDHRLVELVVGLQKQSPMVSLAPKHVLREAARGLVPECVFSRPKRPFSPPSVSWVKDLRKAYGDELCNGVLVQERILSRKSAIDLSMPQSRFGTGNDLFNKYLVLEFWYRGMRAVLPTA